MTSFKAKLRSHAATFVFRVWSIRGRLRVSDRQVVLLYGGPRPHMAYLADLLFSCPPTATDLGRRPLWRIKRIARETGASVSITPMSALSSRLVPKRRGFFIPWWVGGDIPTDVDERAAGERKLLANDFRRFRKFDYEYTVTRQSAEVEAYYRSMYLPFVLQSHGEGALPMSLENMLEKVRSGGELLLVRREGRAVAGHIMVYERGVARVRTVGVLNADRQLMKDGAVAACNICTMRYLRGKGFSSFDDGYCRPFWPDGLLQYKRKWDLALRSHDEFGFFVSLVDPSDAAWQLLVENPFIEKTRRGLCTAFFVHSPASLDAAFMNKIARPPVKGLKGVAVYGPGPGNEPVRLFEGTYT